MVIANGLRPDALTELLRGQPIGTLFLPQRRLSAKKWWIAFSLRQPTGTLVIDAGAVEALLERSKSLLASGVRGVRGRFDAGAGVAITDEAGVEVARGLCNFSSRELERVRGLRSAQAAGLLGRAGVREVVHRDHLVLSREVHA
jgi:glutamate 5-kinase